VLQHSSFPSVIHHSPSKGELPGKLCGNIVSRWVRYIIQLTFSASAAPLPVVPHLLINQLTVHWAVLRKWRIRLADAVGVGTYFVLAHLISHVATTTVPPPSTEVCVGDTRYADVAECWKAKVNFHVRRWSVPVPLPGKCIVLGRYTGAGLASKVVDRRALVNLTGSRLRATWAGSVLRVTKLSSLSKYSRLHRREHRRDWFNSGRYDNQPDSVCTFQ